MKRVTAVLFMLSGVLLCVAGYAADASREDGGVTALIVTITGMEGEPESLLKGSAPGPIEMMPVNGKPMISWVLAALRSADSVRSIIIVGEKELGDALAGELKPEEKFVVTGGKLSDRLAGAKGGTEDTVLLVPPDIVLVTAASIDSLVAQWRELSDADILYPMLEKQVCEAAYPWEKRTYARFKKGKYTGSHVLVFDAAFLEKSAGKVESIYLARKSPLKMLRLIGFRGAFRYIIGRLRIRHVVEAIQKAYECDAKYVITKEIDLATDLSDPAELKHVEKILRERTQQ